MDPLRPGLVPHPGWTLERSDGALLLTAGADLRYTMADVPEAVAAEVMAAWHAGGLDRAAMSAPAGEVVDQLATAGAVRAVAGGGPSPAPAAWAFVGTAVEGFVPAGAVAGREAAAHAAVVVLVRTTATLAELAAAAAGLCVPHLVADVAYHHTVSVGPMVVPGQTACVGCLAGRVSARWGDDRPPPEPAAARSPAAAAIVAEEAARAAAGASRLVNRTVAVDLATWRAVDEAVLRLPWCAWCGGGSAADPAAGPAAGPVGLPWAEGER